MDASNTTVELDLTPELAARVDQALSAIESLDNRRTRSREMLEKFAAHLTKEDHEELERALSRALQATTEKETEC